MRGAALLLAIACEAFPLVVGYSVNPIQTSWSGWTGRQTPDNRVSEMVTCCWDSLAYVELFAGDSGSTGDGYRVGVWEGDVELTHADGTQHQPASWVKFENWSSRVAFTKGKEYEFRFTRAGSDSIQYYYQDGSPYPYGHMRLGSANQTNKDLCSRVHGRLNAIDNTFWGATCLIPPWMPDTTLRDTWDARMEEAGLGWGIAYCHWEIIQPKSDSYDFRDMDAPLRQMCLDSEFGKYQPVVPLQNCPKWASTRIETIWIVLPDTSGDGGVFKLDTCTHCAPRGLDNIGPGNHWTSFIDTLLRHQDQCADSPVWRPCDSVHVWEINNENNDLETLSTGGYTGWWQHPNIYYGSVAPTARSLCSLYVVMAREAERTIHSASGHLHDTILMSSVHRVHEGFSAPWLVAGKEWTRLCYEISEQLYGGPFWDGVSVHAYQGGPDFSPHDLEEDADTVRAIMREHGHEDGTLWNTEFGWSIGQGLTQEQDARNLCQSFVTTAASWARPAGWFDRMCWWYSYRQPGWESWGLLDTDVVTRQCNFYAFKQMTHALTGMRFNGRAMDGDTTVDNHVRMYEFESPATLRRTWVCWKDGNTRRGVDVKLPVRTNSLAAESLAYSKTPPAFSPKVADDGWLSVVLNARPVFISEKAPPMRPDLRVDSVRVVPTSPVTIRAWATNHGTEATPGRSRTRVPYPTWAVLSANGDSVAQQVQTTSIAVNQQAEFTFDLGQIQWPDAALITVTVNPSLTYVELGTDDNTGYTLVVEP